MKPVKKACTKDEKTARKRQRSRNLRRMRNLSRRLARKMRKTARKRKRSRNLRRVRNQTRRHAREIRKAARRRIRIQRRMIMRQENRARLARTLARARRTKTVWTVRRRMNRSRRRKTDLSLRRFSRRSQLLEAKARPSQRQKERLRPRQISVPNPRLCPRRPRQRKTKRKRVGRRPRSQSATDPPQSRAMQSMIWFEMSTMSPCVSTSPATPGARTL